MIEKEGRKVLVINDHDNYDNDKEKAIITAIKRKIMNII